MILATRSCNCFRFLSIAVVLFAAVMTYSGSAQSWMPVLRDMHGDSIPYIYPIADSLYVRNQVVIKFKEGALNKELLCFTCSSDTILAVALSTPPPVDISYPCKHTLLAQQFAVDSGILVNSPLGLAIKSLGGTYLRRMTWANPCKDTLSITRLGDTIRMDHYNWMVLDINNDTNAVNICIMLNMLFRTYIDAAEPNYIYESSAITPRDHYYYTDPKQLSLQPNLIGMPTAWEYQVGSPDINVAVIDAGGLDYRHCDLGGTALSAIPTQKVKKGWNFIDGNTLIYSGAPHGTFIAGIIGAQTNRDDNCGLVAPKGIAGIAGGWGTLNGAVDRGSGVSLLGYRCADNQFLETLVLDYAISAILVSSGRSANTGYGDKADIINASWNKSDNPPSENLRRAIYEAYRHSVTFVAARGNEGGNNKKNNPAYPASMDGTWIISVGAATHSKTRSDFSSYEKLDDDMKGRYGVLDLIAPGGGNDLDNTIYT
ncbi:MAG: S8 family serine peptidase, partial [Ignavibacteriae bacterium]|nr:S8 family serine peptidase [Ignavibacteriota bacterium]